LRCDRSEATEGIGSLRYLFEEYVFDTDLRELRRGAKVISVAPQVFDLLDYLIRNRDCVVSKDDLIRTVWKGRIVSDVALTTRLNAVRSAIGDTGEKQHLIKTLPRKGFRFVARVQEDKKRIVEPVGSTEHRGDTTPTQTSAARLSIVVLPFTNLSNDPEQDYFVDGVTESLTTDLSRIGGSFVIGRHTAFNYKGKALDLRQLGCELNVRYVLEGSVQRVGSRLRVNVQLIDAETGAHLWADRFDKPLSDLFDMQDEIVSRLANTLDARLVAVEARRSEGSLHPNSMDLYFQGRAFANKGIAPEYQMQARAFFERALALDPGNIEALVGLAGADADIASSFMTDERTTHLAAAEAATIKALSIAPEHARAHLYLGVVQISTNRGAQGIAEFEQALALDRNLAEAHGWIGVAMYFIGRGAETEPHIREALRLSPRDTFVSRWMVFAGFAKAQLNADEEAVIWFRRSIEANRNHLMGHIGYAAILALLGETTEAQAAAQAGLALDPGFTLQRFQASASSDNPVYLACRGRIYEGMRIAGVPEG
jgi:TolB-like protein